MSNRVTAMIASQTASIAAKITAGTITQEKAESCRKALDMDIQEYVKFQEMKSLASVDGTLTLEEANTIYGYLGNSVEHFNDQPIGVKVVLTKLYSELLDKMIRRRRAS